MNSQILRKLIQENISPGHLAFEEIGNTWQMSYVRFAGGNKKDFDSIEHFYLSLMKSDKNPNYGYINQPEWIDRVDWIEWCLGLEIQKISDTELEAELKNALEELKEADSAKQESFTYNKIQFPKKGINYFLPLLVFSPTTTVKPKLRRSGAFTHVFLC